MSDFDLRAAVRAVIDDTNLTDPTEIADKVAGDIPTRDLRRIVRLLLRSWVRVEFHSYPPLRRSPESTPTIRPAAKPSAHSAKLTARRAAAPGWLRRRVVVDSTWMVLGECTYDNLRWLQSYRMEKAAQTVAMAEWFGRAAEAVRQHKVSSLGQLSADVLAELGSVGAVAA